MIRSTHALAAGALAAALVYGAEANAQQVVAKYAPPTIDDPVHDGRTE